MRSNLPRLVALVAAAAACGSTSLARAQCLADQPVGCCWGYPVVTGTLVDAGSDALALRVDWAGERAEAEVGSVVPVSMIAGGTEKADAGTRFVAAEVGRPDCTSAPTCPTYSITRQLDGGSYACQVVGAGSPVLTVDEGDFLALNARADCYEALKARLGLAGAPECEVTGAMPHTCECRAVEAPTHGIAVPMAFAAALVSAALVRARARRRDEGGGRTMDG